MQLTRRDVLEAALVGAAATAAGFWVKEGHASSSKYQSVFAEPQARGSPAAVTLHSAITS